MWIFWFSQSPTDHCLPSRHLHLPPLSLVWLSFLCSSQDRWWSSWLGILCWLVTPALHLTSITTSNRYRVVTSLPGHNSFTHNYLLRGCGGQLTCVYLLQCYNILHILYTMCQTSPDRYLLLFSWSEDLNWLPDHLTTRTTARGEGGEKEKLLKIILAWRGVLWCLYLPSTDSAEDGWHLKWTSWACLDTVISLILSYRQSDQIQTHTFIYSSRVEEQEEQLPRFEIISTSGSLWASFFSVIFWNCFTREVLCWWCCMLRLCLAVSKYHHQAHFSVSLPGGLYLLTF